VIVYHGIRLEKRTFYYRLREKIVKRHAIYTMVVFALMCLAPVFTLFVEARGREPLANPYVVFIIIGAILFIAYAVFLAYQKRVVLPRKKEKLADLLEKWLKQ
jgi:hypothetical protein